MHKQLLLAIAIGILHISSAFAQNARYVIIDHIIVSGHEKTRLKTILRELNFRAQDSLNLDNIQGQLDRNKEMLLNTGLFSSVKLNLVNWNYNNNHADLQIQVKEAWYIIPTAWVSLADRNFNIWWYEKNHKLNRLHYEGNIFWNNTTGRKDMLRIGATFGFSQKYELDYRIPGINSKRTIGLFFNTLYSKNREIWYITQKDSLQTYRDESSPQIERFRIATGLILRPRLRLTHSTQVTYFDNKINSEIANAKNPDFFLKSKKRQQYFEANYKFQYERRNNKFYAESGSFLSGVIKKEGLRQRDDVQSLYTTFSYSKYFRLSQKWSIESNSKIRKEWTRNAQPYYNIRALGYDQDYLRGYEYYVVDGTDFTYQKIGFRYRAIDRKVNLGSYIPEGLRYIPFKVWIAIHSDLGYVNAPISKDNTLPNSVLWGKSLGIHMLIYRSTYFQFDISRNHRNEFGFFLHTKASFD